MSKLLAKLRYRSGQRVCVLDAPSGFEAELQEHLPEDVTRVRTLKGEFDLVHAFFTRKAHLLRDAPRLREALKPGAILWLSYPKGKALGTDLNRDIVHVTVAPLGLDTVAQVAIDPVWSALRCKAV